MTREYRPSEDQLTGEPAAQMSVQQAVADLRPEDLLGLRGLCQLVRSLSRVVPGMRPGEPKSRWDGRLRLPMLDMRCSLQ
jgi:hypothetical protein